MIQDSIFADVRCVVVGRRKEVGQDEVFEWCVVVVRCCCCRRSEVVTADDGTKLRKRARSEKQSDESAHELHWISARELVMVLWNRERKGEEERESARTRQLLVVVLLRTAVCASYLMARTCCIVGQI